MKKTKIAAVAIAAVMSVSMLPQTTALPSLGVTASAASTSSKLAAPTGIKSTVSESQIKLSWNEVDGADAYIIYKYDSSTKKYEQYKSVFGTSCTVKNLTAGTKYYFKVAALVKVDGKYTVQTKSAAVSAITAKADSKLAAPTGIKTSVSENQIKLSWNKVSGADAYIIYKYDSATKKYEQYKTTTSTSCTVTGLTAGTKYYFKVAALVKVNGKYTVQTKSATVSATTAKADSKLAAPTGIKTSVSENQIKLSWNKVSGADAYIIYKYDSATKKYEQYKTTTSTSCTVTGLTAGITYKFKVAALVKVDGKYIAQTESNVISATTKSSMRTVPAELVIPSKGATKSEVLSDCGIANYTYDSTGNYYRGEVLNLGINSDIFVAFNSDDTFHNLDVFTPLSYSNYLGCLNVTKDVFGYDYELSYSSDGDLVYTWLVGSFYYSISYVSDLKKMSMFVAYM